MARLKAAVYGGSGYLGAEVIRRLLLHTEVEIVQVCAADHLGQPLGAALPHLEGVTDLRFEPLPDEPRRDLDVLFMALPHDVSARVVAPLLDLETRIIDMSGAFRMSSPERYAEHYGAPHPLPDMLQEFIYGLPEVNGPRIASSRFVASPGCFATTMELAMLPLARAGLLMGSVNVVAITGSSGAGREPNPGTHHPVRSVNIKTYKPLTHPHAPEVSELLSGVAGDTIRVDFVPISGPLSRGIFASCFCRVRGLSSNDAAAHTALSESFDELCDETRFVRRPAARFPEVAAVAGSNFAEIAFTLAPSEPDGTRLVTCFGALDNLVKGGAGQAVQNMNLMLGVPEDTALGDVGGFP